MINRVLSSDICGFVLVCLKHSKKRLSHVEVLAWSLRPVCRLRANSVQIGWTSLKTTEKLTVTTEELWDIICLFSFPWYVTWLCVFWVMDTAQSRDVLHRRKKRGNVMIDNNHASYRTCLLQVIKGTTDSQWVRILLITLLFKTNVKMVWINMISAPGYFPVFFANEIILVHLKKIPALNRINAFRMLICCNAYWMNVVLMAWHLKNKKMHSHG